MLKRTGLSLIELRGIDGTNIRKVAEVEEKAVNTEGNYGSTV